MTTRSLLRTNYRYIYLAEWVLPVDEARINWSCLKASDLVDEWDEPADDRDRDRDRNTDTGIRGYR